MRVSIVSHNEAYEAFLRETFAMIKLEADAQAELSDLRASIDNIDAAMVYLLAERFRCTGKVGLLKARHDLQPTDKSREKEQAARLRAIASSANLDPEFAERFLAFVIGTVVRNHEEVRNGVQSSPSTPKIDTID
jgi:chorismate mutase